MSHTVTVSVSNAEKLLLNRLRRGSHWDLCLRGGALDLKTRATMIQSAWCLSFLALSLLLAVHVFHYDAGERVSLSSPPLPKALFMSIPLLYHQPPYFLSSTDPFLISAILPLCFALRTLHHLCCCGCFGSLFFTWVYLRFTSRSCLSIIFIYLLRSPSSHQVFVSRMLEMHWESGNLSGTSPMKILHSSFNTTTVSG